ncbi:MULTISPECIES: TetR/AcrR family transcriptional regulator [Brevibacillus]|jgi:Transcriptional regulator|uniref:TetR/AcrR family transcriptional regulator n=1 Tax=Brevibacillus TaxID=55080 RepID=UPI0004F3C331|nr:TetR/AcrR family transcriptional regulator [Brevibacillus borstelensis]KKX56574.1 TetR family transcriptional regulator [Brevibacillus borstelensis cifa_chp40]MCM3621797.1 TetR/AcrR family transcriptional regulator [Brevibacillus borstelensis]MED1853025.1 TetR/AcrR family transcriptional regulator [Brevibacillus borstelensis]MED1873535.1 TetR/AcrR family transcriptional regulator [Brevibacillus borstelensis]MED1883553.1 TetR/AcrR family transcriptional regulator [Brevibacillus borstelensis]
MPKFTEQEKEQVRQSLLIKGRELFIQYGLAKTSIDDVILACGIGKGTFYKFFASKEELYFEILKNEEEVRETVLRELFRENLPPKELLASFFRTSFELVEKNPFLQRVFQNDEHERLARKLPEQMRQFSQENTERGIRAVELLIERGALPKDDPQVIVGIMQAVMMMRLHKQDIGHEIFADVMDKIIEFVAEGLTREKQHAEK